MADTNRGPRLSGAGGSGSRTAIMRTACAASPMVAASAHHRLDDLQERVK